MNDDKLLYTRHFQKHERTCRDIKTEKAHKQDWDSTLATKLK